MPLFLKPVAFAWIHSQLDRHIMLLQCPEELVALTDRHIGILLAMDDQGWRADTGDVVNRYVVYNASYVMRNTEFFLRFTYYVLRIRNPLPPAGV